MRLPAGVGDAASAPPASTDAKRKRDQTGPATAGASFGAALDLVQVGGDLRHRHQPLMEVVVDRLHRFAAQALDVTIAIARRAARKLIAQSAAAG